MISVGSRWSDAAHHSDVNLALGYAIRRPSVTRPEMPRNPASARGVGTRLPVAAEATYIRTREPGVGDSGHATRPWVRRNGPSAWPVWITRPWRRRRSYEWICARPSTPEPCTQMARPLATTGPWNGLSQ